MSAKEQQPNAKPPRWLDKLLEKFCAPHLLEEVLGDLHERYHLRVNGVGESKANRIYFREAQAYVRPSFINLNIQLLEILIPWTCLETISSLP